MKHSSNRRRRVRTGRVILVWMIITFVLAGLVYLEGYFDAMSGNSANEPLVTAENSAEFGAIAPDEHRESVEESEAIASDEQTTTSAATTTTVATTTTTTTSTTETTTTTITDKPPSEGRNAHVTYEDLNYRFQMGETWLKSSAEDWQNGGTCSWQSSDCGEIKETYYSCELTGVFRWFSSDIGYSYDYVQTRSDGVWCIAIGDDERDWLVCVAANLYTFPRGSLVRTSIGYGIVCDTGGFADWEHGDRWFDIAVSSNSWGGSYEVFE